MNLPAGSFHTSRKIAVSHILGMEDVVRVQDPEIFTTEGKHPQYFIRPFIDSFDQLGNPTKRQVRIYLGRVSETKKREAIARKNEIMTRVNRSQVVLQAQLRFGELIDYYLKEFVRAPGKISASTRAKYETHIENHIRPAWQDVPLCEIRGLEIDRWITEKGKPRVVDGKIKSGLSWNTRTDLRNLMSGIFTKAIEWGLWKSDNPVAHVSVGRRKLVREKKKLTDEQTLQLLEALPHDDRLICMVALFCTCRISEVLGLRWKHVNLDAGVLQIRERFYRGDVDQVKSQRSERDVQLGRLAGELAAIRGGAKADDFVFQVQTHAERKKPGVCRDDRDINQHFLRPAAKQLGVYYQGFGFHAFRREAITAIARDADALQAMRAAGHARMDTTILYALEDQQRQRGAVEKHQERFAKVLPIRRQA